MNNYETTKELFFKVHKQLMQLNTREVNNPFKKWAKDLNRHFSKEDIQMANKHMKRCSASLIIESEVAQSCLTLCNPMGCSLPGSSVHGISQAVVLEWIAISFSRGSSQSRTQVSCIVDRCFTV